MDRYSITAAPAAAIVPAEDLKPALVSDFISFIDRGEKTTRTYLTNLKQFFSWLAFEGINRPARADIIPCDIFPIKNNIRKSGYYSLSGIYHKGAQSEHS